MELKRVKFCSAVYVGVIALVMYLIVGALQLILFAQAPELAAAIAASGGVLPTASQALVMTPIIGAVVGYVVAIIAILVYNFVAQKYPIAWEIKK